MLARFCNLFILILLFQVKVSGQDLHTISGTVKNEKGERLQYVSVFMAGSTRGTQTDKSGKFVLNNITAGNYQLIISFIGYDRITRSITIKDQDNYQEYELKIAPVNLKDVVVGFDPDRDKHLALFKKFFIGETANARQCLLLNPEAIHTQFNKNTQLLSVSADSLLVIDNQALGYRVKYLLTGFELDLKNVIFRYSGIPVFEELKGNDKKRKEWERLRQKAYNGSVMHFFRSAYSNSVGNNGFILYSTAKSGNVKKKELDKLDPSQVFSVTDSQFVSFRIGSPLYIAYINENTPWDFTSIGDRIRIPLEAIHKNAQVSKITMLCDSLIIDKNGNYVSDKNHSLLQSIDFQGYWAWEKVADLLPFDYPDKNALLSSNTYAQIADDSVMKKVAGKVDGWLNGHQPEKAYLQTDKPYYAAGDNIWFKLYITVGNQHHLSALSGSVNVELLDGQGSVKQWIRLPVVSGMAHGDLALPDTLRQGKYGIRAYTNWMRNAGPGYYFDKQLTIGNVNAQTAEIKKARQHKVDIRFFPESGNLVNGLHSVVAFKAVGEDGLGIDVKGTITDDRDNKVCQLNTSHMGMGKFSFTPEKGKTYKAQITYPDGTQNTAVLPDALNRGYVLHIDNIDTSNIRIQVASSGGFAAGQVYLYAQAGGETFYTAKNRPGIMPFNAIIPKSRFPEGIVQFTLFSSLGEPLSERIAFINHPEELLKLDISQDKTTTATQGKVKIGLDVHDALGKAVTGNFSVAVIDESKVKGGGDKENTIVSQLLLTADLRGYIEEPAYYFNKTNDSTQNNLDILMLTQGYRRFEWKPLLAGAVPPAAYPAGGLADISGTVKTRGGKPVPGAKVTLISGDGSFLGLDTTANGQGRFNFTNLLFRDSLKFVLQASSEKNGRDVDIILDDNYNRDPKVNIGYLAAVGSDEKENLSAYLASNKELYRQERKYGLNNHAIVLKEVNVRAVRDKPKLEHSSNLNGPGNANMVITAEELKKRGSINLWHTIQKFVVKPLGRSSSPFSAPEGITFILDGDRVDHTMVDNIPIAMVSSVEYLSSPGYTSIYGPAGQNGVFVITTKGIGDTKTSLFKEAAPGILAFAPKGYYLAREFYSPQYNDPKTNKVLANLRTAIYWQPDLVTDKTGHASFEYYNAGSPGTYRVVVEGIGADGNLGRRVYRYKVE